MKHHGIQSNSKPSAHTDTHGKISMHGHPNTRGVSGKSDVRKQWIDKHDKIARGNINHSGILFIF